VKKSSGVRSVGDAQSFRKENGKKLKVAHSGARVFHYGWVRTPEAMKEKTLHFDQLYHGAPTKPGVPHTGDNYLYKRFWGLKKFEGTHPIVMDSRIKNQGWHWDLKSSPYKFSWKDSKKVILDTIERVTRCRLFEYKSYKE
jgi:hypothetical protein